MSDELEARMWDDGVSRYESRGRGTYFESAFASSEHLDHAPLLADILHEDSSFQDTYTDVPVTAQSDDEEHCHWKLPVQPPSAIPQLVVALVLCGFFMICELIGGYLAGSLSVMCDAAHMLSDCGGFALALLAFHCAKREPNEHMTYGYKRAEVLGAMVSVLLIWILTGVFVYVAAVRLHTREFNIEPDMMMIVSGCGVGFNVILALVLHGCATDAAHHHTHGGAPCSQHNSAESEPRFRLFRRSRPDKPNGLVNADYSMKDLSTTEANLSSNSSTRNINLRAALIHVIGDLIQSCGVLLASVLIKFYPSAKIVDPICTFVFSVLVLVTSARVVRDAIAMLMQRVPQDFRYKEVFATLSAVSGVRHVHSLHVWALSTHHIVLTAHVAVDSLSESSRILSACHRVARTHGIASATFQLERYSPRMATCRDCRHPSLEYDVPTLAQQQHIAF